MVVTYAKQIPNRWAEFPANEWEHCKQTSGIVVASLMLIHDLKISDDLDTRNAGFGTLSCQSMGMNTPSPLIPNRRHVSMLQTNGIK